MDECVERPSHYYLWSRCRPRVANPSRSIHPATINVRSRYWRRVWQCTHRLCISFLSISEPDLPRYLFSSLLGYPCQGESIRTLFMLIIKRICTTSLNLISSRQLFPISGVLSSYRFFLHPIDLTRSGGLPTFQANLWKVEKKYACQH